MESPKRESVEQQPRPSRGLSDDLVREILSYLPFKTLMQFKCVSKPWIELLSNLDHFFIKLQHGRVIKLPQNPGVLFWRQLSGWESEFYYAQDYNALNKAVKITLPFNKPSPIKYCISGISNGLICLSQLSQSSENHYEQVHLWNPLTRAHVTISCPPLSSHTADMKTVSSIFGFSQDKSVNDYKLVRIDCCETCSGKQLHSHVNVYTLGTDTWRSLDDIPYYVHMGAGEGSAPLVNGSLYLFTSKPASAPLVNGALHWFTSTPGFVSCEVIVAFDMKHESFTRVPIPSSIHYMNKNGMALGELGGSLCIVYGGSTKKCMEIWVMTEYGAVHSWTMQVRYDVAWGMYPVTMAKDDYIILQNGFGVLALHKPKDSVTKRLERKCGFLADTSHMYSESFASPTLIHGVPHILDENESEKELKRTV